MAGLRFRCNLLASFLALLPLATTSLGDDWPTFRRDNARSSATPEKLDVAKLGPAWTWRSPHPPNPAWAGPAKWDAYANVRNLSSMRDYDPVFHVSVADGRVFFGSSADDTVRALDAKTGKEQWRFVTDGPVRITPSVAGGKLYFGSDDGFAYCVHAKDGKLAWRFSPKPDERLVLNNGRMISFWPVRTGVLLHDKTAYFAASMLPWRGSYMCAVDAATGEPKGDGRYVNELKGSNTFEGALLAAGSRLIAPQGRVSPLLVDRKTGTLQGQLDKGGGGCFAIVTPENEIIHGPGNRQGRLLTSNATSRAKLATYPNGKAMVVAGDSSYLLKLDSSRKAYVVSAIDRKTRKERWQVRGADFLSMIVAGDTLFVGTVDQVIAIHAATGKETWRGDVEGKVYGMAVADGALFASTDEGTIHCFRPDTTATTALGTQASAVAKSPKAKLFELAVGPLLQFIDRDTAVVRWETKKPAPTVLEYGISGDIKQVNNAKPKLEHEAKLENLRRNRVYTFVIKSSANLGESLATQPFECDTFFNYDMTSSVTRDDPFAKSASAKEYASAAVEILKHAAIDRGICLVLGSRTGHLAYELAKRSRLRVVCVDTDAAQVAKARKSLGDAQLYGNRVSVHHVESLDKLPFPSNFANLIVSETVLETGEPVGSAKEMYRVLRPSGGVACLGQPSGDAKKLTAWFEQAGVDTKMKPIDGGWAKVVRPALDGAGQWTHQYGNADNSAFAGETLGGAAATSEFVTQWLGRPGPRFQPDRNGRKPGPLSASGRLFAQGLHRIVATDAYNGTILWSAEIPDMIRMNMPRDSSNWCADSDHVFVAIKDRVWQFDAANGKRTKMFYVVPGANSEWTYDWGYVASHGDLVIGSAVKQGAAFTGFWGKGDWYDAPKGSQTDKICSDNLFALDKSSGTKAWEYSGGVVVNSTITIGDGRVYFIECRNSKVREAETRRIGAAELWQDQYLVALDVKTGRKAWERAIDTHDGVTMFSLAHGGKNLAIVASGAGKFHVYAHRSKDGTPAWNHEFAWPGGKHDHGKAMSRPAIVGDTLYVRPKAFALATGKVLAKTVPGGGCGTYACTENSLFFRAGNVTMWDARSGKASSWARLRPGCWLSTIPAAGMLLSPEAGGGCSCGNWLETSIAMAPKEKPEKPKK